jgi:hypothetical protein
MSRNQLKILAVITMTIDHVGAFVLTGDTFIWMRVVGRLAFPIFMFLFAEGAHRSKADRRVWFATILGFAIVTQLLFNWVHAGFVNILFLFALGLIGFEAYDRGQGWLFLPLAFAAEVFKIDYGMYGIAALALFYIFDNHRLEQFLSFAFLTIFYVFMPTFKDFFATIKMVISDFGHYWRYFIQDFAIAALIPIGFYNPKKNKRIADPRLYLVWKYFFYVYYPLHVTILCLIGKK